MENDKLYEQAVRIAIAGLEFNVLLEKFGQLPASSERRVVQHANKLFNKANQIAVLSAGLQTCFPYQERPLKRRKVRRA